MFVFYIFKQTQESMQMDIDGKYIRQQLRAKHLPYGEETVCCGGKVRYNKNYAKQLKLLGLKGDYTIKENGIVTAFVKVD